MMTYIKQLDSATLEHSSFSGESESSGGTDSSNSSSGSSGSDSSGNSSNSSSSSFSFMESFKESSKQFNNEIRKRLPGYDPKKNVSSQGSVGLTFATLTESMSMTSAEEMVEAVSKTFSLLGNPTEVEESSSDEDEDDDDDDHELTSVLSQERLNKQMALLSPGDRAHSLLERIASLDGSTDEEEQISDEENGSRDVSLIDVAETRDAGGVDSEDEFDSDDDSDQTEFEFEGFPEDALAALNGAIYALGNCNFTNLEAEEDEDEYPMSNVELPAFIKRHMEKKEKDPTLLPRGIPSAATAATPKATARKGIIDTLFQQCGGI